MSIRFSIVVPVGDDAEDLDRCLRSLCALDYPSEAFEIIVVAYGSTDSGPAMAARHGLACLRETQFRNAAAARNRGIEAARGEFIAFTEPDCIADARWLAAIDAVSADEATGCFAGEILSVAPTTRVERFCEAAGVARQKASLSGRRVKPYAQLANAVYRKAVFDRIGLFAPAADTGGDAAAAWRMQARTPYTIRFVPDAVVHRRQSASLPDLYARLRRQGESEMAFALADPDHSPPAIAPLEAQAIALFDAHLAALQTSGAGEDAVFSALRATTAAAHLSGYLQTLLRHASNGATLEDAHAIARARAPICDICGCRAFMPGPRGRLSHGRPPQCRDCGSLERHRVLHRAVRTFRAQGHVSLLCVGEDFPAAYRSHCGFAYDHRATLAALPGKDACDLLLSINAFSRDPRLDLSDALQAFSRRLGPQSALILFESGTFAWRDDLAEAVAERLPNALVAEETLQDHVTGDIGSIVVARPRTEAVRKGGIALPFYGRLDALVS